MNIQSKVEKSNFELLVGDDTFKLLQDIHDGNEPNEKLAPASINSKVATLYLARELNFLRSVASVSGHRMTAELLNSLHIELLKTAMNASQQNKNGKSSAVA